MTNVQPYYDREGITLYCGRAEDVLPTLADASVSLVGTDPPYYGVKDDDWDNQWATEADFLAWIGGMCDQWRRVLRPNGSLYVFASPGMAWGVEGEVRQRFNVLGQITWAKSSDPGFDGWKQKVSKESLRQFYPHSERIIFGEQMGSDRAADDVAGYTLAKTSAARNARAISFGTHIKSALDRAGVTCKEAAAAIGAHGNVNHGGSVSNWVLGYGCPTEDQYIRLMEWLNVEPVNDVRADAITAAKRAVSSFDALRENYHDLRRPFTVTAADPYTDVWDFPTVNAYPGKHPCEKPAAMARHIIKASSRPGDVVLDSFAGSGWMLLAARDLGRRAIGIEQDERWCARIVDQLRQGVMFAQEVA